ncbi:Uncharacterised protein [uncultured archaeon]|nr:Uncharacterised protein [uncultured archaeon]
MTSSGPRLRTSPVLEFNMFLLGKSFGPNLLSTEPGYIHFTNKDNSGIICNTLIYSKERNYN